MRFPGDLVGVREHPNNTWEDMRWRLWDRFCAHLHSRFGFFRAGEHMDYPGARKGSLSGHAHRLDHRKFNWFVLRNQLDIDAGFDPCGFRQRPRLGQVRPCVLSRPRTVLLQALLEHFEIYPKFLQLLGGLFSQYLEADASGRQVMHRIDEVEQVTAEAVEFPHQERISLRSAFRQAVRPGRASRLPDAMSS